MSQFLKNLPLSFYRTVISSRPVFNSTPKFFWSPVFQRFPSLTNQITFQQHFEHENHQKRILGDPVRIRNYTKKIRKKKGKKETERDEMVEVEGDSPREVACRPCWEFAKNKSIAPKNEEEICNTDTIKAMCEEICNNNENESSKPSKSPKKKKKKKKKKPKSDEEDGDSEKSKKSKKAKKDEQLTKSDENLVEEDSGKCKKFKFECPSGETKEEDPGPEGKEDAEIMEEPCETSEKKGKEDKICRPCTSRKDSQDSQDQDRKRMASSLTKIVVEPYDPKRYDLQDAGDEKEICQQLSESKKPPHPPAECKESLPKRHPLDELRMTSPPRLDGTLPQTCPDKTIVGGSKSFFRSLCEVFFAKKQKPVKSLPSLAHYSPPKVKSSPTPPGDEPPKFEDTKECVAKTMKILKESKTSCHLDKMEGDMKSSSKSLAMSKVTPPTSSNAEDVKVECDEEAVKILKEFKAACQSESGKDDVKSSSETPDHCSLKVRPPTGSNAEDHEECFKKTTKILKESKDPCQSEKMKSSKGEEKQKSAKSLESLRSSDPCSPKVKRRTSSNAKDAKMECDEKTVKILKEFKAACQSEMMKDDVKSSSETPDHCSPKVRPPTGSNAEDLEECVKKTTKILKESKDPCQSDKMKSSKGEEKRKSTKSLESLRSSDRCSPKVKRRTSSNAQDGKMECDEKTVKILKKFKAACQSEMMKDDVRSSKGKAQKSSKSLQSLKSSETSDPCSPKVKRRTSSSAEDFKERDKKTMKTLRECREACKSELMKDDLKSSKKSAKSLQNLKPSEQSDPCSPKVSRRTSSSAEDLKRKDPKEKTMKMSKGKSSTMKKITTNNCEEAIKAVDTIEAEKERCTDSPKISKKICQKTCENEAVDRNRMKICTGHSKLKEERSSERKEDQERCTQVSKITAKTCQKNGDSEEIDIDSSPDPGKNPMQICAEKCKFKKQHVGGDDGSGGGGGGHHVGDSRRHKDELNDPYNCIGKDKGRKSDKNREEKPKCGGQQVEKSKKKGVKK